MFKVYAKDFDGSIVTNAIDTIDEIKEWLDIQGYTLIKVINNKTKEIVKI